VISVLASTLGSGAVELFLASLRYVAISGSQRMAAELALESLSGVLVPSNVDMAIR
jgi:hypothetical protein